MVKIRLDQNDNRRLNSKTLEKLNSLHIRIDELERQQSASHDNPIPTQGWKQWNETTRARVAKEILDQEDWSQKELERSVIADFRRQQDKEDWKQKELERRARIKELLKDKLDKGDWSKDKENKDD